MPKLGRFRTSDGRARYVAAYDAAMTLVPAPDGTSDLDTAFGTVHASVWFGDRARAPVLLLPGMSSGTPMWAENLPDLLESGRTVVAFDALGDAGLSVQTAPLVSVADQARWVDEALAGLGVDRVHSVGHSFGGATAANHAVRHPRRVASLALVEPVFTLAWPPPSVFWWATVATVPGPPAWRDHALARLGGVPVEEVRRSGPIGDLISVASETFESALPTPRPLTGEQLAALRMPTYVAIAGRRSLAGGARAARRAASGIPGVRVEVWPEATHSLPMQERRPLAQRLRALWDRAERELATP